MNFPGKFTLSWLRTPVLFLPVAVHSSIRNGSSQQLTASMEGIFKGFNHHHVINQTIGKMLDYYIFSCSVINVTLHFGSQNIIGNKEPNQLVLNSDQMFIYPQWDMRSMRGDLALVRLLKDVPFTDNIRPVCLPKANDDADYVGDSVTLTGWGSVSDGI